MSRKRCSKCGEMKGVESFSRNRSRRDGLDHRCKACQRRYREENREKILERKRLHYEENREKILEYSRRYREENREVERERRRRRYEENREAELEYRRRYCEENREAEREYHRQYCEENRGVLNEIKKRRQKKINEATREIATRNGEPWTLAEDAYIMSADEPSAIMAMELGRTIASVRNRAVKLRKKTAA